MFGIFSQPLHATCHNQSINQSIVQALYQLGLVSVFHIYRTVIISMQLRFAKCGSLSPLAADACRSEFTARSLLWCRPTKSCTDSCRNIYYSRPTSVRSTTSPTYLAADLSVLLPPTV